MAQKHSELYPEPHLDAKNDLTVQASGGPKLDRAELRWQFTLSALQQGVGLLGAVPQIYKMCKKAETWHEFNLWLNNKQIQTTPNWIDEHPV